MLKAGSVALAVPSDTEITMGPKLPAEPAGGVPLRLPVLLLNASHAGLPVTLKVSALPSASDADGWKLYATPSVTVVVGLPPMVGGVFALAVTVSVNAGSEALALPSDTVITMGPKLPAEPAGGVPLRLPVLLLNASQAGLPVTLKVSALPSASDADGWKLYATPSVTVVVGLPPMVGAEFGVSVTLIENGGSVAESVPSDTEITMGPTLPAEPAGGVPLRRPVLLLNASHAGLPETLKVSASPSASDADGWKLYATPSLAPATGCH